MCVLGVGEQRLPLLPDKRVSVAHERQSPWAAPMRIPPGPRWPACHPPASAQPLTWGLSMYQRRQLARVSRIKYLRRNLPLFSFSSISRNPQIRFCRSTYGIPGLCSHHPAWQEGGRQGEDSGVGPASGPVGTSLRLDSPLRGTRLALSHQLPSPWHPTVHPRRPWTPLPIPSIRSHPNPLTCIHLTLPGLYCMPRRHTVHSQRT